MVERLCSNCAFYEDEPGEGVDENGDKLARPLFGNCHRYPPGQRYTITEYDYWCGEWCDAGKTGPMIGCEPAPPSRRYDGGTAIFIAFCFICFLFALSFITLVL